MPHLSGRELAIMRVLWRDGPMTAQQIRAAMAPRPDNSTVRTFLRILERKGHVRHVKQGRAFLFRASTTYKQASREAVDRLVDGFFDGSLDALVEWTGVTPRRGRRKKRLRQRSRMPRSPGQPEPETVSEPADAIDAAEPEDAPWLL